MAARRRLPLFFVAFLCFLGGLCAGDGGSDPIYIACVEQCEKTGCVGDICFQQCNLTSGGKSISDPWYLQEPLYIKWKKWDCLSGCQYHCMHVREEERQKSGDKPIKYHGKWPLRCAFGIEEPVAVALSALNLAVQFHGWVSFNILVNYKLPLRLNSHTYYEYTGLCNLYGALSMNFLFWSAVYHSRDVEMTEKLDYSSGVAVLGFSLIVAILRAFNVTSVASRVMVAAPLFAFLITHILYLNFYQLDYGLNMKVCVSVAVAQLVIWGVWAGVSSHPSRWKIWLMAFGEGLIIFFQMYDFPPYMGFLDAHAVSHAIAIPVSYIWWSFVHDDSEHRTAALLRKAR